MTSTPHHTEDGPVTPRARREPPTFSFVRLATLRTVSRLQSGYRQDVPAAVAAVARLRREAGREAHSSPTSWGLDHLEELASLREEERDGQASAAGDTQRPGGRRLREWREEREDGAVHLAVTLWALHQQSVRDEAMHVREWTLGRAVRRLAEGRTGTTDTPRSAASEPSAASGAADTAGAAGGLRQKGITVEDVSQTIRKRFVRIGTATDFVMVGGRLREMVLLLRDARIPLDYGLLADQLHRWQDEAQQGDVRRTWGRDFHRAFTTGAPAGPPRVGA